MNIKQKTIMIAALFTLVTGLTSSIYATTLGNMTTFAYTLDEDCGKYSTLGEETACLEFQKAGTATDDTNADVPEQKCVGTDCCGGETGVKTSIITDDSICNADGEGGVIFGLLKWVLLIMTAGVGIAAVGGIAWGALLYTTAESKPEQTKKAIGVITNVVIGLVAYALMGVLLNFLIPGGVFN